MSAEGAGSSLEDLAARPAWRMRTIFERKIMAAYRDTYRGELGAAQVEALEVLWQEGKMRQQDLADALRTSKQHASKIVGRLEELGLAGLAPDEEDGRCHWIFLTEEGRAFVARHIQEGEERIAVLLSSLTGQERAELDQAMETVARLLEKA